MSDTRAYVGIDPGKTGAICLIIGDKTPVFCDWYDNIIKELRSIKNGFQEITCLLERQQPFPKQGLSSTFQTGFGYGQFYGALQALQISFETIRSQDWMKGLGIPGKMELKARKRKIAEVMANKYPSAQMHGPRGGLKDGRSDALAIADCLRMRHGQ